MNSGRSGMISNRDGQTSYLEASIDEGRVNEENKIVIDNLELDSGRLIKKPSPSSGILSKVSKKTESNTTPDMGQINIQTDAVSFIKTDPVLSEEWKNIQPNKQPSVNTNKSKKSDKSRTSTNRSVLG